MGRSSNLGTVKNFHLSISSRPVLGPNQPSRGSLPGGKAAGKWSCPLSFNCCRGQENLSTGTTLLLSYPGLPAELWLYISYTSCHAMWCVISSWTSPDLNTRTFRLKRAALVVVISKKKKHENAPILCIFTTAEFHVSYQWFTTPSTPHLSTSHWPW
jgi:hypothetical protein